MHPSTSAAQTLPHPLLTRQPTFRGQQPDEIVIALRRGAMVALLLPAWPVLVGMTLLGATLAAQRVGALPGSVGASLSLVVAVATLVLLAHWAITHATPWWFRLAIITNQRVIFSQGIVRSDAQTLPLSAVQAVQVVKPKLGEALLGYGNVQVGSAGGTPLLIVGIARPDQFAQAITQTQAIHAPPAPTPTVADATLQGMLERMGQGEALPAMPTLDARLTRNWPFRHAFALALPPSEAVLGMVSRHWWALAPRLVAPLALIAGAAGMALVGAWGHLALWPVALGMASIGILGAVLLYLNFVDDAFIFTTKRIISVKRRYFLLHADEEMITYDKIQKSELISPGLLGKLLHFGTVRLNVGGENPPELLDMVPYPALVLAAVDRNSKLAEKRATVAAANGEKTEIKAWFAEVLAEMVVAAPELRGLSLEDALTLTYDEGMRLVVLGDAIAMPGYPPGIVISQSPSAGARSLRGGDISVMLTRA